MFLLDKAILFSSVQLNINYVTESCAVEPMYYVNIGTIHKFPDYQVVLVILFSLHAKVLFVTVPKCVYVDYVGLLIFKLNDHLNSDKGWSWSSCLK